jgi:hypothetical protein
MAPGRHARVVFEQMLDEVTAGKPGRAGDERNRQRRWPYCW